jgi:hypothetical protein
VAFRQVCVLDPTEAPNVSLSPGEGAEADDAQAKNSSQNKCYGDLCFGVFALSVEIRSSAAGGMCVS